MSVNSDWNAREGDEIDPELERELTSALRPLDPPSGFADRVLARALAPVGTSEQPQQRAPLLQWSRRSAWAGWAVAAGLLASVFLGGDAWQQHRAKQLRCAEATAQFETAEKITDRALDQVRQQIAQAGVDPADVNGWDK